MRVHVNHYVLGERDFLSSSLHSSYADTNLTITNDLAANNRVARGNRGQCWATSTVR